MHVVEVDVGDDADDAVAAATNNDTITDITCSVASMSTSIIKTTRDRQDCATPPAKIVWNFAESWGQPAL
jgi:hypothetical protein